MKILYVGDPHATQDALPEMHKLLDFIIEVARRENVNAVCLLGDLFHNHALVHLNVMEFWYVAFKRITDAGFALLPMIGNHDMPGADGATAHALLPFRNMPNVHIVDTPFLLNNVLFMPYYSDHEQFIRDTHDYASRTGKTVVCHMTFNGSTFENGFYAKDGLDSNLVKQDQIISGHIHKPQEFGKVWYPGAPRWRTLSDANTERAIWVVEHDTDGSILTRTPYDTSSVCTPIFAYDDTPENPAILPEGEALVIVDVRGPTVYVNARKAELEARGGVRVRTFPRDERTVEVKESEGIPVAFNKFAQSYKSKGGTDTSVLVKMASERISWMRVA